MIKLSETKLISVILGPHQHIKSGCCCYRRKYNLHLFRQLLEQSFLCQAGAVWIYTCVKRSWLPTENKMQAMDRNPSVLYRPVWKVLWTLLQCLLWRLFACVSLLAFCAYTPVREWPSHTKDWGLAPGRKCSSQAQTENVQTSTRASTLRFSPLLCCNGTFVILIPYWLIQYLEVLGLPFMQTVFSLTDQFTAFLLCY